MLEENSILERGRKYFTELNQKENEIRKEQKEGIKN